MTPDDRDIGAELVLDGELIAGAGRLAHFYVLAGAVAARQRTERLTFVCFDLLTVGDGRGGVQAQGR